MSDLWSTLGVTSRALAAQRAGLDITGQNIANAATPGYARREVALVDVPGRGVEMAGITAVRDVMLERRLREERPGAGREGAVASSLALVETTLGRPGESIDGAITRFFDAFAELAGDPASATVRQGVVLAGQSLAQSFNVIATNLADARRYADAEVRLAVDEANELTERIAALNGRLSAAPSGTSMAASFEDQLHGALHELAEIVDIDVIQNADGSVGVAIGGGRALVSGPRSFALGAVPAPPFGFVDITSHDVIVTGEITSGRLGGHLHVRDTLVEQYQLELDTLAFEIATGVNAVHATGFDGTGAPAGNFFTPPGAVTDAAALLTVLPGVLADPQEVAAAAVALAGDNGIASSIAALRDAPAVGSMTFADAWGQLAFNVGHDALAARQDRDSRDDVVRQIEALRDSVSGVSLDEEAMRLMQFQRAYEANARVFRAVDEVLATLINMLNA